MLGKIPFNKVSLVGKEIEYVKKVVEEAKHLSGNGIFTHKCQEWIKTYIGGGKILLTSSGTDALEMMAILANIKDGDEVIMPSFTFVSTANAFILRGAKPVFVDIREDTLNMDETKIEEKITTKTKAIIPVHYAGVSCEMDKIISIAQKYDILVLEDAAQALGSKYKNKYAGTIGDMAILSFHETKNITSGEGGALIVNNDIFDERAEIIWEKGTNRSQFFRGEIDKYTWVDIGSSFLMSDIQAAFLFGQMERWDYILEKRKKAFYLYKEGLGPLEEKGYMRLPIVPENVMPNYHIFYILLNSEKERDDLMNYLKKQNIHAVFHYIPLHLSPMGKKYGKISLSKTEDLSKRLLRLPLWVGVDKYVKGITNVIKDFYK